MFTFNREKTIQFCRVAVDWLLLSLVFLAPLYFAFGHEIYNTFTLDKVVLLRVLVTLAALFFLIKIFLAGKLELRFSRKYLWLAVLLAAWWLFTASFSSIAVYGFWGYYTRQQGFFTLIFYLLFLALLLFNSSELAQIRRLIGAMLFSSVAACLYGLVQFFNLDPIHWAETGRIFSTFGQPNFFGHWLILVIPFSVYALVFWARRFSTRLLNALLLLGELVCLFFTYSRSAWIGMAAEIFLAILLFLFIRGRKKIAIGLIILTLAGLVFASTFFSFSPRPAVTNYSFRSRLLTIFDFSQGSIKSRLNTWQAGLAIFRNDGIFRKLVGFGPDSLYEPFTRHYQPSWALEEVVDSRPDRAHNLFLDTLLSFGLVGLAIYLLIFVFLVREVWLWFRVGRSASNFWLGLACLIALAGYLFNNLFSFSDTPQFLYFYLILGFLIFSLSGPKETKELRINLTAFSQTAILLSFFFLAAIFVYFFNFKPLAADYYLMQATEELNDNCPQALSDNSRAIAWGAGNSLFYQEQYLINGLTCFDRLPLEDQEKLKNNMLLYLDTMPADKFFSIAESRADVSVMLASFDKSFYPQAEHDFTALAENYPTISIVYRDWAVFEFGKGDFDQSIAVAEKGLSTLPLKEMEQRGYFTHRPGIEGWQIDFYDIIGDAYAGKKDWHNALSYYENGVKLNPYYLPSYQKIAAVYSAEKDWDQAIWYNKKGYRLNPNDYSWPLAIARLSQIKGDKNAAIDYFNKVLLLNPGNQEAQNSLAALKSAVK